MINLIDYILDLFRDEGHAQAFVANPDQALADAGLSTVTSAQLQSVAATAIPSLAMDGGGDPVADLQNAVSNHYGLTPTYAPQPDLSPSTDLASNNSFMSPCPDVLVGHGVRFAAYRASDVADVIDILRAGGASVSDRHRELAATAGASQVEAALAR